MLPCFAVGNNNFIFLQDHQFDCQATNLNVFILLEDVLVCGQLYTDTLFMTCRYLGQLGAELFIINHGKSRIQPIWLFSKVVCSWCIFILTYHVIIASIKKLITLTCTLVKEEMGLKCLAQVPCPHYTPDIVLQIKACLHHSK